MLREWIEVSTGAPHMPREVGWEWDTTGWWVKPRDSREVMTMIGSIGVYSTGQRFAWRGMASADCPLISSLHRHVGGGESDVRAAELEMIAEAREWGLGTHPTGKVDDLQLLSDPQHYGIATRLIDVTSNPMTALWFACQQPAGSDVAKSGLLLATNVTGWRRLSTVSDPDGVYQGQSGTRQGARLDSALYDPEPFIVESASPNARLRAQEGFFISGRIPEYEKTPLPGGGYITQVTPFKSIQIDHVPGVPTELRKRLMEPRGTGAPRALPFVAMIIPAGVKSRLLKYLQGSYNRSARVLFPDYEGYRQFGSHPTRRVQTRLATDPSA